MAEQNNFSLNGLQPLPQGFIPAQLFLEVKDCLNDKNVKNYIMGLGGRDITPKHIEKSLEFKGEEVSIAIIAIEKILV